MTGGLFLLSCTSPFMRGRDVRRVQIELRERGYLTNDDDVDDIYGPKTEAAVRQFQTDQGIMIDGVVGPETYGQLGID